MPGDSGVTLRTRVRTTTTIAYAACGRIGRPAFPAPSAWRGREFKANLAQNMRRDRDAVHSALPSLHAPLRVAGSEASKARSRGRGWGVYQQEPLLRSMPRPPPPPPPPRRFAGGGER